MEKFENALGFAFHAPVLPRAPVTETALLSAEAACSSVRKDLSTWVCDMPMPESVPFTQGEIATLLEGTTVGGYRLEDEWQLINRVRAWSRLLTWVEAGRFRLEVDTLIALNAILGRDADLQWGLLQDRTVPSGGVYRRQMPGHFSHPRFDAGVAAVERIGPTLQRGAAFFLFACLHNFMDTYNEGTAWLMMNGVLLGGGLLPLRLPPGRRSDWNMRMMRFYDSRDGNEFVDWLMELHEDVQAAAEVQPLSPE